VRDFLAHKGHNALTKWITPARDRFRDRERTALDHNDNVALDELEMFRKDVGTFPHQYDFFSQIADYENPAPEKLSIYPRHLALMIAREQQGHEIDLSTVDFEYIAQYAQGTTSGTPSGGVSLEPARKPEWLAPEMVALEEVIARINNLFSGDQPYSGVRNVVTHINCDPMPTTAHGPYVRTGLRLTQFTATLAVSYRGPAYAR
jgi:type I restriction enzyme, R subunit